MTYHLKDALRTIRRSPYQSVAAVLILTQTFFLAYIFALLMTGSEMILRYFETQPQVTAFFKADIQDDQITEAKTFIEGKDYIKSVKQVTKNDALENYRKNNQDDPVLLQLVTTDILPGSLQVSTKDIQSLPKAESDLKSLEGIDEVVFQKDVTDTLAKWTNSLRIGGVILLTIMGITSMIQIIVITSMKISAKRVAIKTMQLLGATRRFIKAPFILEGMLYGLMGAITGWIAVYVALMYLTPWLLDFLGDIPILPVPPVFMGILLAAGSAIGIVLGGISSLFAAQRFLE